MGAIRIIPQEKVARLLFRNYLTRLPTTHRLYGTMSVLLMSTYDLGHQPFALASLCASLSATGADVICNDIAVEPLNEHAVKTSSLIAVHLAMHTATRLALDILPRIKNLNPDAHVCFFGLYAPIAEKLLLSYKNMTFICGEFETGISALHENLCRSGPADEPERISRTLTKQTFLVPDRGGLPPLSDYAYLEETNGKKVTSGYTEASRGCKHLCRHCPIVPVYEGRFFVVSKEIVLADIRQQVAVGAGHISFGDPDFFNGPGHAVNIIKNLNREFPDLGYDVIIKIEHLLKHRDLLPVLKETGCRFITTAVESIDDDVLKKLEKGHTCAEFIEAVDIANGLELVLSPTFIPFTPWTTVSGFKNLLQTIADLALIDHIAPVQLSIRLLIPEGSRLLEIEEIRTQVLSFDNKALSYPWKFSDPQIETLADRVALIVEEGEHAQKSRSEIFSEIWTAANEANGMTKRQSNDFDAKGETKNIPRMSEPWYCCAEPSRLQNQQF